MKRLGISIYPEKSSKKEILDYIDLSSEMGFSRIFSCLLSVNKSKDEIKKDFIEINKYAKSKGFEVIVDVAPNIFSNLGISYNELEFFDEINADGVRLDIGFTGNEEAIMTFNKYNYNLYGCHNFYPHIYSGLNLDYFIKCTERFLKYGIKTAAFVTSQNKNTFGPWPVTQGLPTLEMHRFLPLDVQIKHFLAIDCIDDILISNCYPSYEELNSLKNLDMRLITFDVEMKKDVPEVENDILFKELHFNRGDKSENMIRSTQSRLKYKGHEFKLFNAPEIIKRGDIVIESSKYGHYAGELQIALKEMKNTGMSNVVGKVCDNEIFLLDYIKPWQKFKFRKKD